MAGIAFASGGSVVVTGIINVASLTVDLPRPGFLALNSSGEFEELASNSEWLIIGFSPDPNSLGTSVRQGYPNSTVRVGYSVSDTVHVSAGLHTYYLNAKSAQGPDIQVDNHTFQAISIEKSI